MMLGRNRPGIEKRRLGTGKVRWDKTGRERERKGDGRDGEEKSGAIYRYWNMRILRAYMVSDRESEWRCIRVIALYMVSDRESEGRCIRVIALSTLGYSVWNQRPFPKKD